MNDPNWTICTAQLCARRAVALVTDMEQRNLEGYAPVCISHVMTAVSNGLARGRREAPGYRRPFMLIPLDSDYLTTPTVGGVQ